MRLTFIYLSVYAKDEQRLHFTDDDRRSIEDAILENPTIGAVIPGTSGLRKFRYARRSSGGGKSGGTRICYYVVVRHSTCYMITAFSKNEQSNLSRAGRNAVADWIRAINSIHERNDRT